MYWYTKVTISGKLTDIPNGGTGLGAKTITFTSPNGSPLPASVHTKSGVLIQLPSRHQIRYFQDGSTSTLCW